MCSLYIPPLSTSHSSSTSYSRLGRLVGVTGAARVRRRTRYGRERVSSRDVRGKERATWGISAIGRSRAPLPRSLALSRALLLFLAFSSFLVFFFSWSLYRFLFVDRLIFLFFSFFFRFLSLSRFVAPFFLPFLFRLLSFSPCSPRAAALGHVRVSRIDGFLDKSMDKRVDG